jgi:REP element-mobilizing transposase RayT
MSSNKERKNNRMNGHDYSKCGWYFITICTKDKQHFFCEILNGKMLLNEYGAIVEKQWLWLADRYDYIKLDKYIVMPDHIHGILIIENNDTCRDNPRVVPTFVPTGNMETNNAVYYRRHNLLSKTINAFKTTSSKLIHINGLSIFLWQRSFYDHIIRDEESLQKIRDYIRLNPLKWVADSNDEIDL